MSQITREWRIIQEVPKSISDIPVRQVYVWLITSDDKIVIVSKDGENWQLPGGKPDGDENAIQTAVREVYEETGIDLTPYARHLTFFGEYTINDTSPDTPNVYRQVRSWVRLPHKAADLNLTTTRESPDQQPEDAVRFVQVVAISEVHQYIPWLLRTDEYRALEHAEIISA